MAQNHFHKPATQLGKTGCAACHLSSLDHPQHMAECGNCDTPRNQKLCLEVATISMVLRLCLLLLSKVSSLVTCAFSATDSYDNADLVTSSDSQEAWEKRTQSRDQKSRALG